MLLDVKKFNVVLQQLMKERNLSARELAKRTGLAQKTVSDWVGEGASFPRDPEQLKKLADFFECSIHKLLFGEEDPRGSVLDEVLKKTELHTGLYEISIKRVDTKK